MRKPQPGIKRKLALTHDVSALYHLCHCGRSSLDKRDEQIVIQLVEQQFPAIGKDAARTVKRERRSKLFWFTWIRVALTVVIMCLIIALIAIAVNAVRGV